GGPVGWAAGPHNVRLQGSTGSQPRHGAWGSGRRPGCPIAVEDGGASVDVARTQQSREVLARAIAASQHWLIIHTGRRSTFDSNIGRNRATAPGDSRVMDDACGSANRVQRPQ